MRVCHEPGTTGPLFNPGQFRAMGRAALIALALAGASPAVAAEDAGARAAGENWNKGKWSDPNFFPIGVWLQSPANVERFRRAGINVYVGLWEGPTEEQLATLQRAGMSVICAQNEVGLRHRDDPLILGWMQDDEPDNAQSRGARFGWSAPISPEQVVERYRRMKAADATRPVLLNLGQGVAWDGWYGRGTRKNHPEDYPAYLKGCDIASFDIYPAVHRDREVAGKLWLVARGVERLVNWTGGQKPVWNCIEAARVQNPNRKPAPEEVRGEVWMALIHGSRGLIYFVHQFKPKFVEAALLDDGELLAAVTALNRQVMELAPVLNRPTVRGVATVQSLNAAVPVATMVKRHADQWYLFAVAMRAGRTTATFAGEEFKGSAAAEVLGEQRTLAVADGRFTDRFGPWEVHLYRLK
jgi:hypothetical protein